MATRSKRPTGGLNASSAPSEPAHPPRTPNAPVFGQPEPTADPTTFRVKHPSDTDAYHAIDELNKAHGLQARPFPKPRGDGPEPLLTLGQVFGGNEKAIKAITGNGQIVFHSTGDCGSTRGPKTQNEVVNKMIGDFNEADPVNGSRNLTLLSEVSEIEI